MLYRDITGQIIKSFYNVYNNLGYGFLEKIYENALKIELRKHKLNCYSQYPVHVYYEDKQIGKYYADLVVNNKVILELKASENLCRAHELQLINYLKATDIEVGLLLNFGEKPQFQRKIFSNKPKNQ